MVQINKQQRKYLEDIGVIKSKNKNNPFNGMTVANINSKSRKKSIYVEDEIVIFLDPDWYRRIMAKYMKEYYIEKKIKEVLESRI